MFTNCILKYTSNIYAHVVTNISFCNVSSVSCRINTNRLLLQLSKPFLIALVRNQSTVTSMPENPLPKRKSKPVDWLPFPWQRRPLFNVSENSGDLVKDIIIDLSLPKPGFELSEELKTADDDIKKIFSLATASEFEIFQVYTDQLFKRIQRHPFDFQSLEVQIALTTTFIRSIFQPKELRRRSRVKRKVKLFTFIQKRNKLLKILRDIDYDRYCWLVKELQVEHQPSPTSVKLEKYCKKWDLRRLTKEYSDNMVQNKKAAYHEILKSQQELFLKEKAEILAFIAAEEKALGVHKDDKQV